MPLHELVQAAHVAHELVTGAQIEMIRVAQHERGIDIFEMFGGKRLDRCLRAHRSKDRCEKVAMRSSKNSRAGAIVFGCDAGIQTCTDYTGRRTADP